MCQEKWKKCCLRVPSASSINCSVRYPKPRSVRLSWCRPTRPPPEFRQFRSAVPLRIGCVATGGLISCSIPTNGGYFTYELCSKFLLISWETIQSLRRSLRSLTFSKVLLTAQQLQRTSLRISYGKLSRQTKEWNFSEKHVLGRCIFPHLPGEGC